MGTVFQRLMDTCQLSTTAQASEPKKEDAVSLSPPPGVVNQYGCKAVNVQRSNILAIALGFFRLAKFIGAHSNPAQS